MYGWYSDAGKGLHHTYFTELFYLLQPVQAEGVLGHRSLYRASWLGGQPSTGTYVVCATFSFGLSLFSCSSREGRGSLGGGGGGVWETGH